MTAPDYTHLTLVVDRSGSMAAVRTDAEGAINQFIRDLQAEPGRCTLTLVDFDAPAGVAKSDWYAVRHDGDLTAHGADYQLHPRGSTALLDAVGRAITETGETLATFAEEDRPGKVVFVVQTDGQENSSRDWTWDKVREAVKHQHDEFAWEFVFLGMSVDAWDQGGQMGFGNVVRASSAGGQSVGSTYTVMGQTVNAYRAGSTSNLADTNVDVDEDGNVIRREPSA